MMMKMTINLSAAILLALATTSIFGQEKQKDFDYGRIENNTYFNSFFGLKMTIPKNWIVQSKEQSEGLANKGKELIAGDDTQLKKTMDAVEINTAFLLTVFQYELGAAVEYNPGFIIIAENVKNFPGIKNGSDYLFHARKLIELSQLKYDHLDSEFKKVVINETTYFTMNARLKYQNIKIKQVYYSTLADGFVISIVISYTNKKQKRELIQALNSIKFSKS